MLRDFVLGNLEFTSDRYLGSILKFTMHVFLLLSYELGLMMLSDQSDRSL